MRRTKTVLAVIAVMAAMLVAFAAPALADDFSGEFEQEAESGEVDQDFDVSGTGDNSNQTVGIQGVANTGNAQNQIGVIDAGDFADFDNNNNNDDDFCDFFDCNNNNDDFDRDFDFDDLDFDSDQDADSGDVDQTFVVTNTGDNSNQCVGIQGAANTGNAQNQTGLTQLGSNADDFEFDDGGSSLEVSPTNTTTCDQEVNQAATAYDGGGGYDYYTNYYNYYYY
jgi:hypothetical protein